MLKIKITKAGLVTGNVIINLVKGINALIKKNTIKKVTGGLTMSHEVDGIVISLDPTAEPTQLSTAEGGAVGGGGDGSGGGGGTIVEGTPTFFPIISSNDGINANLYTSLGRVNTFNLKPIDEVLLPGNYEGVLTLTLDVDSCVDIASSTWSWLPLGTVTNDPVGPSTTVRLVMTTITISPTFDLEIQAQTSSINVLSLGTDLHITKQA